MSFTRPARGMRDFLPEDIRKREYVIGIVKEVYEKYGFDPLETPTIENLSTLTNKYGEEGDQLMYKILKRGEKLQKQLRRDDEIRENDLADLALRYDLTVPLARVIANYRQELPRFFKRYQIQPVWRADRPARGRYREFYQCDVDAIGSKSMVVEAELCAAVSEILERLGFDDFFIRTNHRGILTAWLRKCGVESNMYSDALVSIDKADKIGVEGVRDELNKRGFDRETSEGLIEIFELAGSNEDTLSKLSNELSAIEGAAEICDELRELFKLTDPNRLKLDPSLARGLSYYTGAIFEVELSAGDFSGSIAGGGRYDGLIGMFGKEEIPAAGLSLGLERIILIMTEREMFPETLTSSGAQVLVTIWNEEKASESMQLAGELRSKGLRVLLYPQADKLGKQFKYADQIGTEYVCVLGESEINDGTVSLKNMKTGEQQTVERDSVGDTLGNW